MNDDYKSPYEEFKKMSLWHIVSAELTELEENKDLKITTHRDLVIGSIVKRINESYKEREEKP